MLSCCILTIPITEGLITRVTAETNQCRPTCIQSQFELIWCPTLITANPYICYLNTQYRYCQMHMIYPFRSICLKISFLLRFNKQSAKHDWINLVALL